MIETRRSACIVNWVFRKNLRGILSSRSIASGVRSHLSFSNETAGYGHRCCMIDLVKTSLL